MKRIPHRIFTEEFKSEVIKLMAKQLMVNNLKESKTGIELPLLADNSPILNLNFTNRQRPLYVIMGGFFATVLGGLFEISLSGLFTKNTHSRDGIIEAVIDHQYVQARKWP